MAFYRRKIFPWLMDRTLRDEHIQQLRVETLQLARGEVVELGFGTGLNLEHYPKNGLQKIFGVEPNAGMESISGDRVEQTTTPVEIVAASAEKIPLPDRSADTVVSTFTLCSVQDVSQVLSEVKRLLRPGGTLLLLEHGLAPDRGVRWWQNRLTPIQKFLADGCHLNRDMKSLLEKAGFRFQSSRTFYLRGAPRPFGYMTLGSLTYAGD